MRSYILRRLLQMIPVLFLASIVIWAITYALPGSPADAIGGQYATADQIARINQRLGLDQPVMVQYGLWLGHVFQGDLGSSYLSGHSVLNLLVGRIPATAQLAVFSMVIGIVVAAPLGVLAALRRRSWAARIVHFYEAAGLAVPTFWLGLLLILLLALEFRVFPALANYVPFWQDPVGMLQNTFLPAVTIGIHVSAILARFISASCAEVLEKDFVRTARSKGVSERRVIMKHALRNALLPTVTIAGLQLGTFLGGTVVVEVVFNYPGLGRLIYSGVSGRDYAVVQGAVLFIVVLFLILNLLVDLLYAALDPRVRLR